MDSLLLLMGLLLVAYLGSFLVGGRSVRGVGLPSSVEWVVLGFVVGPHVMGVVSRALVDAVEPVIVVALSWLLLVDGVHYGSTSRGRVSLKRTAAGIVWAGASGGAVAASLYWALPRIAPELMHDRLILALALGAVSSETTNHVMRWVRERHRADGPLTDLLEDITATDHLVPIGMVVALAAVASRSKAASLGPPAVAGITVGFGMLLGLLCALLLGREFRLRESWGTVLGISLLGIGVSAQLGLSYLAVLFFMGLLIALVSRHTEDVRAMLMPTERGALLPVLILCGVRIEPGPLRHTLFILGVVLGARIATKLVLGRLLSLVRPVARPAGGLLATAMLSSGSLTMCIGLVCALGFPGATGDTILTVAAGLCVAGELLGPPSLRAALKRAGELHPEEPKPAEVAKTAPAVEDTEVQP
ncbi:MAG TPA: potassium transporter Kef [Polyangiaceae bacterium]|nr:potassium transporter Kef [Polyangiaceae bacterium]